MRCKGLGFLENLDNEIKNTYDFKSSKFLPSVNQLSSFESGLLMINQNVQPVQNRFLSKLKEYVKTIKKHQRIANLG